MAAPTGHARTSAQLSFDNAYNFHGSGSHVMASQDFPVQLQHHPFALSHHESPAAPHGHGLGRSGSSRPGHTPSHTPSHTPTTLMYDTSYHPTSVNGQAIPYHVSMTGGPADKNSLLAASSRPVSSLHHHQGNLQPGYLPRQVETSSLSCDEKQQSSTGYPGSLVTGPLSPLVTQDQRVTSSSRLASKDPPPLPPPPLPSGLYQPHTPAPLTSPINQPTFLAFRAAEELEMEDDSNLNKHDLSTGPDCSQIAETKLSRSNPTSSSNPDSDAKSSTLTRSTAAPHLENKEEDCKQFKMSNSFVSISAKSKALKNSTSKVQSQVSIITLSEVEEPIEDFPRLDGNSEIDVSEEFPPLMMTPDHNQNVSQKFETIKKKASASETPKEVLESVLANKELLATISASSIEELRDKQKLLQDVSPLCDCVKPGMAGTVSLLPRPPDEDVLGPLLDVKC